MPPALSSIHPACLSSLTPPAFLPPPAKNHQSCIIRPNSRWYVSGHQEATTRSLSVRAAGQAEAAGGGKRAAPGSPTAAQATKRPRAPPGAAADPLDPCPDTPMHLMRVREEPRQLGCFEGGA